MNSHSGQDGGPDREVTGRSREDKAPKLPRRFYETVGLDTSSDGIAIVLDGKPVHTPGRAALSVPGPDLAAQIAEEWDAQKERIDPASMPLTKLANTAIDRVAPRVDAVVGELVSYGESDLLCYRAETPEGLVDLQCEHWDPVLAWARDRLNIGLTTGTGIIHVKQPELALENLRAALAEQKPFALAGVYNITTLTGSIALALSHLHGILSDEAVWAAAHVDEDWQISQWGRDDDAARRRALRFEEMRATARWLALLGDE